MSRDRPLESRRRLFLLAGGALSMQACSSSAAGPARIGDVVAVNASSLPNPSLEAVGTLPVCIGRDTKGVYAMTLTCTHAGCTVDAVAPTGLVCPCHGSTFDANGDVTGGPAPAPLQHFLVTADASGLLTIHTDQDVSADTRLTGL
ncbi:MAG: Rieske (2Fe-2S) protein [Polyangiaceae bacterium]|nr:Rieske (2Fe-2S) protein [Polyangiaceae bacterium]